MGAGGEAAEVEEGSEMTPKQKWIASVVAQRPDWNNARDLRSLSVVWSRSKRK